MWSVGAKTSSGSRGLLAECGLSGQVWRVGQEACWRSVVCRDKYGEWVKGIVDGVWSVGSSLLRGSKELSAGCGLSAQVWRVGQEACRWYVVCRGENVAWVKGIVDGVWSVGASLASGSKELSAACGLSGQVWRVGQGNWRRRVVCRRENVEWVKEIGDGCGLSGRKGRVGQEACWRSVVCRDKYGEWVKEIGDGCGLSA